MNAIMKIVNPCTDELWEAYLACRYRNLYEEFGLPPSVTTSALDEPRERPDVLHRCVVVDGTIAACGRLDLQPDDAHGPSSQLRYFAVDKPFRGSGAGAMLLAGFEHESRERGLNRLWMEARTAAANFYARQGYADIGPGPLKYGLIPHRVMVKQLAARPVST